MCFSEDRWRSSVHPVHFFHKSSSLALFCSTAHFVTGEVRVARFDRRSSMPSCNFDCHRNLSPTACIIGRAAVSAAARTCCDRVADTGACTRPGPSVACLLQQDEPPLVPAVAKLALHAAGPLPEDRRAHGARLPHRHQAPAPPEHGQRPARHEGHAVRRQAAGI